MLLLLLLLRRYYWDAGSHGITTNRCRSADSSSTHLIIGRFGCPGLHRRFSADRHVRSSTADATSEPRRSGATTAASRSAGLQLGRGPCDHQEHGLVVTATRSAAGCSRPDTRRLLPADRYWSVSSTQRTCRHWGHVAHLSRLPDDVTGQRDVPASAAGHSSAASSQHDVIRTLNHHGDLRHLISWLVLTS